MQDLRQLSFRKGGIFCSHSFGILPNLVHDLINYTLKYTPVKSVGILPGDKQPPEFLRPVDVLQGIVNGLITGGHLPIEDVLFKGSKPPDDPVIGPGVVSGVS